MPYTVDDAKRAADEINALLAAGETGRAVRKAYALRRKLRGLVGASPQLLPNLQKCERAVAQMETNGFGGLRIPLLPIAVVLVVVGFVLLAMQNASRPQRTGIEHPEDFSTPAVHGRVAQAGSRPASQPAGDSKAATPSPGGASPRGTSSATALPPARPPRPASAPTTSTPSGRSSPPSATSTRVAYDDEPIPRMTRRRSARQGGSAGGPSVAAASIPTAPPAPAWDAQYLADARQTMRALEAMSSVTKVGVSYREYPSYLQACQVAVDRFISEHPQEKIQNLNASFRGCLAPYHDVYEIWGVKFEGREVENFVPDSDPRFQSICRDYPAIVTDQSQARTQFGWHISSLISQLFSYGSVRIERLRGALRPYGI